MPSSGPTARFCSLLVGIQAYTSSRHDSILRFYCASGSPFAKVEYEGKTLEPGQGNNMYVFPGIGLGAIISETTNISDAMIETSAIALSESLNEEEKEDGLLYPRLNRIREISSYVALRVIRQAQKEVSSY